MNPKIFQYQPCLCGGGPVEPLPNGVPEEARNLHFREIIDEYSSELGRLCIEHYSR